MLFFLTALKVAYMLDPNLQPIPQPKDGDFEELKAQRRKHEDDEVLCRGHIMDTLSYRLYNMYTSVKSPRQIWTALEYKYTTQK